MIPGKSIDPNLPNIKGSDIPGNFTTDQANANFDLVSYISYGPTSREYGKKASIGCFKRRYVSTSEMYNVVANRTGNRPGQIYQDSGGQPVMSGWYHYYEINASEYNSIYNDSGRINPRYHNVEWWMKFK